MPPTPYYQDDLVTLHHGDARALPLPDESVDLIATSPPYFKLRSYRDAGEHYDGQIGSEPTWQQYLDNLLDCTREWMRVLKPTGSMFVNLGDKYGPNKNLLDLPWRYGIRCVDELGLIKRAEIIWAKPNGLPESVTDRVRRSHEVFVHLTKAPRYFAAVDEIREPVGHPDRGMTPEARRIEGRIGGRSQRGAREADRVAGDNSKAAHPLGKLPGSVWEIATQPLRVPAELGVDHFAAFPMEWPRRLILGWSPREVCTVCGEGRRPVVDRSEKLLHRPSGAERIGTHMDAVSGVHRVRSNVGNVKTVHRITGYACACPDTSASSTPGVVLDPFGGTGTTALVAAMHGRQGISVDASQDYCRLAEWRVNDPKQRERAGRAAGTKPPTAKRERLSVTEPTAMFDLPA